MLNFTPSSLLSNLRRAGFAAFALLAVVGCADDPLADDPIHSGPAAGERAEQPSIAISATGRLGAVWAQGNQIHYSFSDDDGETWLPSRQLEAPLQKAAFPTVAAYQGKFYVAYVAFDGEQTVAAASVLLPPALSDIETVVLGAASLSQPHIVPDAEGLQIAFRSREDMVRYARLGSAGLEPGLAYPAESTWLCGAEDGSVYAVERGASLRVLRLSPNGRQPIADFPILQGFSDDAFTCAATADSLFVSVGVSDQLDDPSTTNALYVYQLDRETGALVTQVAEELYRSKQPLLSPRLVTTGGDLGAIFYKGAQQDLAGELHHLRTASGTPVEDVVIAEPELFSLTRSLSYASRGDEAFLLYEDGGFVGFTSL